MVQSNEPKESDDLSAYMNDNEESMDELASNSKTDDKGKIPTVQRIVPPGRPLGAVMKFLRLQKRKPIDDRFIEYLTSKYKDVEKDILEGFLYPLKIQLLKPAPELHIVPQEIFTEKCAEILINVTQKHKKGLIVTFNLKTRDISEIMEKNSIDLAKQIYVIDCISYASGLGSPPIPNVLSLYETSDLENVFYYTLMQLKRINSNPSFIAIVDPGRLLKDIDYNEIGVFFNSFTRKFVSIGIPVIFICQDLDNVILLNILAKIVSG